MLRSEQSADYIATIMEDDGTGDPASARESYLKFASFWEAQLKNMRIDTTIISDADLLTELDRYNLLILPAAYALSEPQIDVIKAFLAQRKGVIMTHITGNKDARGLDRSWTLTEDVVGGELLPMHSGKEKTEDRMNRKLFFASDNALSAQTPPAYALPVATFDYPFRIKLREGRAKVAAAWEDPGGLAPLDMKKNAGALLGDYRGGRFVWLGFTSHSVANLPEVWSYYSKIIENSINWAGHRVVVDKANWPVGKTATTIGLMNEQNLFDSESLKQQLESHGIIPGIYLSEMNVRILPLGREGLFSSVELGPRLSVEQTDKENPFDGQTLKRLEQMRVNLEERFGDDVFGFSSSIKIDRSTKSLADLDFEYIWLESQYEGSPKVARPIEKNRSLLFRKQPPPLVFIRQGARSDALLIEETKPENPAELLESMKQDYDRIRNLGGLYSISLNPSLIASPTYKSVIEPWLKYISKLDNWNASPMELTHWWRKQEGVLVVAEQEGSRIVIRVSNEGGVAVEELRLFLYYPTASDKFEIRAERIRTPIPTHVYDELNHRVEIMLKDMNPGENRTYFLE